MIGREFRKNYPFPSLAKPPDPLREPLISSPRFLAKGKIPDHLSWPLITNLMPHFLGIGKAL